MQAEGDEKWRLRQRSVEPAREKPQGAGVQAVKGLPVVTRLSQGTGRESTSPRTVFFTHGAGRCPVGAVVWLVGRACTRGWWSLR